MTSQIPADAELTVVATFPAAPGKADSLRRETNKLVAASRLDDGCIAFDPFEDIERDGVVALVERWESEGTWRAHLKTDRVMAFAKMLDDLVSNSTMHALRP